MPAQMRFSLSLIVLVMSCLSVVMEAFFRCNLGARALGVRPVGGFLLLVLYAAAIEKYRDVSLLVGFIYLFVIVVLVRKLLAFVRWLRGRDAEIHSYSIGQSWLERLLPWMPVPLILGLIEPALVFGLGYLIRLYDVPLGSFLMLAALGLAATYGFARKHALQRERDLQDALLEQQDLAHRMFRRH